MKKYLVPIVAFGFIFWGGGTAGATGSEGLAAFSDVPVNDWAYTAVNKLATDGIIEGYNNSAFQGATPISRYEMAILIARAMTKVEKANATDKEIIKKLGIEYDAELKKIGAVDQRIKTVNDKEDKSDRIKFSGEFYTMLINFNDRIESPNAKGSVYRSRFLLNVTDKVDDATTIYTRFGVRNYFGGNNGLTQSFATNTAASYQALDHYGVKHTDKNGITYNVGRQDIALGQGLLLSTGGDAQWNNQFDGLVVNGKLGTIDATVLLGKTTSANALTPWNDVPASWYGVDLKNKIGEKISVGATFVRHRFDTGVGLNLPTDIQSMWAVNTSIKINPHLSINAEYGKSDADSNNQAFHCGATYTMGKDSLTATYINVEGKSIDPYNSVYSGIGSFFNGQGINNLGTMRNWSGMTYSYAHQLSKNTFVDVYLVDATTPGQGGHDVETGIGWHVTF